jgi:hypothetical protein
MVLHQRAIPTPGLSPWFSWKIPQPGEDLARLWERLPKPMAPAHGLSPRRKTRKVNRNLTTIIARRTARDPDLWLLELTIADAQQFIGNFAGEG